MTKHYFNVTLVFIIFEIMHIHQADSKRQQDRKLLNQ